MKSLNRRNMMVATAAAAAAAAYGEGALAGGPATPQWDIFEVSLKGPKSGNPFDDIKLSAIFQQGDRKISINGFYDGDGIYKLRFMPNSPGKWTYKTISTERALNGKSGIFDCVAPKAGSHGPVGVRDTTHFGHADGTPNFPFGTTSYAWIHQSDALQAQTLEALKNSPFNKIRMCVFPKHYEYNHNEPALYPFERDAKGVSNYDRPNPAFYHHLETRISDLTALGIQVDLIIFHPYDRWGYATMTAAQDDRYLRYLLARVSSYQNVWWSLANEYDFLKAKTMADWDRFFHIVENEDPYGHLRSIHYGHTPYDYGQPWVTHASLQTGNFEKTAEDFAKWHKPISYDEVQYEGNLNRRWGNLSGEEMTYRFWRGVVAGAYVTHGETLLREDDNFNEDETPTLWWSHGGKLNGTSPERIGFLRKLLEDTLVDGKGEAVMPGLEADLKGYYPNAVTYLKDGKTASSILYYFDYHRPIWNEFALPVGKFKAELIDLWEMKIAPIDGTFESKAKLKLANKPYQALRFKRI